MDAVLSTHPMRLESPVGAEIVLEGRKYINFGGSSYLGLSGKPEILEAGVTALRATGAGYVIPRFCAVVSGAHEEVEAEAAAFFGTQAALYLASGYATGLAAISALKGSFQLILYDKLSHYALRDASAASGLPCYGFEHSDPESLADELKRRVGAGQRPLIVTDGLFSVWGEIARVGELAAVAERYDGHLFVDESHSFGILGRHGRGVREYWRLEDYTRVTSGGSLGKAFGCSGGIILGSADHIARLRSTPIGLGASSGSPVNAALCARALAYARRTPSLLLHLRHNTIRMKSGLRRLGLHVGTDEVPIAAFQRNSADSTRQLQQRLMSHGIFVLCAQYVGTDATGVIRCGIFADHTPEHIDFFLDALRSLL